MAECLSGHQTQTEDFCDQCGMPVVPIPVITEPAGPTAPVAETCPHCTAPRQSGALFCESCGYDYTTGALPEQDLRTELGLPSVVKPEGTKDGGVSGSDVGVGTADAEGAVGEGTDCATSENAGESVGGEGTDEATPDAAPATETVPGDPAPGDPAPGDSTSGDPAPGDSTSEESSTEATPADPDSSPAPVRPSAPTVQWVAEIWTDPQWYAFQESADPMPPLGPPRIVPIKESALIGRRSVSRNIHPDVDCGADVGCSRRQAYLTFAGGYWFINDLESANGTFVAEATASLPDDPITARTQVGPDERIYLGAWTRIVVRPATEGEIPTLTGTN